jgi:tRNA-specific 2-thiouridylase
MTTKTFDEESMSVRCVVLLSGGLDSMLAVRIMQEQQIEVEALNFKTIFTCCQDQSAQAARDLGVPLTVVGQDDDYLDLIRAPRFGYGKGANPCVDCRIYMFEKAKRFMRQVDAQFVVSGEIVGQRPMSQKRKDLAVISYHSGLDDLLLRPLSAKLLPPTLPERQGWVDRARLYDFHGRARGGLIELAKQYGLKDIPTPSVGCALTERGFARKVHDLIQLQPTNGRWDFEVLKFGRHFRFDAVTKIIVGRDEAENEHLSYLHKLPDALSTAALTPDNFMGPTSLVIGPPTDEAISFAGGLVLRYSRHFDPENALIIVEQRDETRRIRATMAPALQDIQTLSGIV